MPSRMGSSWARNVGSSLLAVRAARTRAMLKAGLSARPALTAECASCESTELRECGGQVKICRRIVSVGLDRPSEPLGRLLTIADVELRQPRDIHPDVSQCIARTEAQGFDNVSLCFFGATDKNLTKSDMSSGAGKISIQRQRMFTFGDALLSPLGHYLDQSQIHMAKRMVRDRRQGLRSTSPPLTRRRPRDRPQRTTRPRRSPQPPIE